MKIYFSGANNRFLLEALKDRHVLETFADLRPIVDPYRPTWKGAMLDSGAYTAYRQGHQIDLSAYIDYALEHKDFYEIITVLDDIAGDVSITQSNLKRMVDAGLDTMPVFHQGEDWAVLKEYTDDFNLVGLGFQRPITNAKKWLSEVWSRLPETTKIHGFGMTHFMGDFPFHSVDSTTWFMNVNRARESKGKAGEIFNSLTPGEMLEIYIKSIERAPRAQKWDPGLVTSE